ncbi:hypothetical protein C8J57DRAFT_1643703 [Mycena rebaudengoi]|nr:hypothetical protein C8J57DRAFT_1643703 [Mycena rebaudengoi]
MAFLCASQRLYSIFSSANPPSLSEHSPPIIPPSSSRPVLCAEVQMHSPPEQLTSNCFAHLEDVPTIHIDYPKRDVPVLELLAPSALTIIHLTLRKCDQHSDAVHAEELRADAKVSGWDDLAAASMEVAQNELDHVLRTLPAMNTFGYGLKRLEFCLEYREHHIISGHCSHLG